MHNFMPSSNTSRPWAVLARRHPEDPFAWIMAHRTIAGQPLVFVPALEDIARDLHRLVAVQKPAQTGMTELAVGLALHAADSGYGGRGHVGFYMPTENQM